MLYYLEYDDKKQMYLYKKPMKLRKSKKKSKFSLMVYDGNFYVMDSIQPFVPYDKTRISHTPSDMGSGMFESTFFILNQMNLMGNKATDNKDHQSLKEQSSWRVMGQMLEAQPKLLQQMFKLIYNDKAVGISNKNIAQAGLTKERTARPILEDYENSSLFAKYYDQKIAQFVLSFDKKSNSFQFKKDKNLGSGQVSSFGLLEFLGNFYVVKNFKNGQQFSKNKHVIYEPDQTTRGLYESLFFIIDKEVNKLELPVIGTAAQVKLTNIMMLSSLLEKDKKIRNQLIRELKTKLNLSNSREKENQQKVNKYMKDF